MSPCQEAKRGCAKDLGGGNWRGTGLAAPIRGLDGLIDPRAPMRGRREICYTGCIPRCDTIASESVAGVADAPANLGGICAKGATLGQVIQTPDRLVMPQLRTHREKERRHVGWAEALT